MCEGCPCGWGLEFKDCGFALGGVCVGEDIEDVEGGLDCHSRSRSLGSMLEDRQRKEFSFFSFTWTVLYRNQPRCTPRSALARDCCFSFVTATALF